MSQTPSKFLVICKISMCLALLSLGYVVVRWPDWQRLAVVRRASHAVVNLSRPEDRYFRFDGAASREVGEFIFRQSRPFHVSQATAFPIYVYFCDNQNRCVYSCALGTPLGTAAAEFRERAKQGVEITEEELDSMFANEDYEKDTRLFR